MKLRDLIPHREKKVNPIVDMYKSPEKYKLEAEINDGELDIKVRKKTVVVEPEITLVKSEPTQEPDYRYIIGLAFMTGLAVGLLVRKNYNS